MHSMIRRAVLGTALLMACAQQSLPSAPPRTEPWRSIAERMASQAGRASVNYADPQRWACADGPDLCDETHRLAVIATDATMQVVEIRPAPDPAADCFYIYPTVDIGNQVANHDDLADVAAALNVVGLQAAAFAPVCRVFAPYYRQAKLGAYLERPEKAGLVFLRAFADVAAAFEYYLEHWNRGRAIVILGHSQGAQMAAYLLHRYFDGNTSVTRIPGSETSLQLRARLVMALPVGFNVFTPAGERLGGSFSDLPLCADDGTPGCIMAYRSFPEGYVSRIAPVGVAIDRYLAEHYGLLYRGFREGEDELACVNPAAGPFLAPGAATTAEGKVVQPGETRLLLGTYWRSDLAVLNGGLATDPPEQILPGRYTATCRKDAFGGWLAIGFHKPEQGVDLRGDPVGAGSAVAFSLIGLHLVDFHLPMGDLIVQVRRRVVAHQGRN